jgi:hypothetical protein
MTLYSQLKDLGFLVPGKDKATHQRWMNGKNNRVVILTRIAIEGGERGDSAS